MQKSIVVIIPSWNAAHDLPKAIDSILAQTYKNFKLIIVDNGSTDDSRKVIEKYKKQDARISAIYRDKNYGYTGGVNPGFEQAIAEHADYAAPFNNDAVADKNWLKHLADFLDTHADYGIAACNLLHIDGNTYDSSGDQYSVWGLPYPRDRDLPVRNNDQPGDIFGASGGASLYRVSMLKQIGLFDQDFFAYYEDIDLSFRAQLAGWKVRYVPASKVFHEQGATSKRMANGFTTYQYMKNLPWIIAKDVPLRYWWRVIPRFIVAYNLSFLNAALKNGKGGPAIKGVAKALVLLPKKLLQRRSIYKDRKVSDEYIWSLFLHDLPPTAHKLRKFRSMWWRIRRRGQIQSK